MIKNRITTQPIDCVNIVKKVKSTTDNNPLVNSRRITAPMLRITEVQRMMSRINGYEYLVHRHDSNKTYTIPYCLPLDKLLFTCPCSAVFK